MNEERAVSEPEAKAKAAVIKCICNSPLHHVFVAQHCQTNKKIMLGKSCVKHLLPEIMNYKTIYKKCTEREQVVRQARQRNKYNINDKKYKYFLTDDTLLKQMALMETLHGTVTTTQLLKLSLNTLFFTDSMSQLLLKCIVRRYFNIWSYKCTKICDTIKGFEILQRVHTTYFLSTAFSSWKDHIRYIPRKLVRLETLVDVVIRQQKHTIMMLNRPYKRRKI